MKRILLFSVFLACTLYIYAQQDATERTYKEKRSSKEWPRIARTETDAFFSTPEASRIGDNVLLYQYDNGGWAKNIYMPAELTEEEKENLKRNKGNLDDTTIDNNATMTEIVFLARLYDATGEKHYAEGALHGLEYLLESQYDNGGWPQFYPRNYGYYTHITYNDNAMENVLKVLYDVSRGKKRYKFVPDDMRPVSYTHLRAHET